MHVPQNSKRKPAKGDLYLEGFGRGWKERTELLSVLFVWTLINL